MHREEISVCLSSWVRGGADTDFFTAVTSDRTQGAASSCVRQGLGLGIRKRFFTWRGVGHWHRLLGEAVTAPSLTKFKKHLDNIPGTWCDSWKSLNIYTCQQEFFVWVFVGFFCFCFFNKLKLEVLFPQTYLPCCKPWDNK